MKWKKKGLIFAADNLAPWAVSHAMLPVPHLVNDTRLRIYLTFCDSNNVGRLGYIDVDPNNPQKILQVASKPLLEVGVPGTFDDNGAVATCIVNISEQEKYLYYVGFELCTKIRYRLLSGLAISHDGGNSFQRYKQVPILERSDKELFFRCGPFVMFDEGKFKMWYVAGSGWTQINNEEKPLYNINYLESSDGIHWADAGLTCIQPRDETEYAFGRPYVIKEDNLYKMFFSIRKNALGYRLGYAESNDGIHWTRKDEEIGIETSETGWDSEMLCYSSILKYKNKTYLFYNGNGFGKTGVGYAELV